MPEKPENLEIELSAYLDGELDQRRRAEVDAWLRESAAARSLLADLERVRGNLAALPRQSVPPGLRAGLEREFSARQGASRAGARIRLWAGPLAAAAAVAIAVGAWWQTSLQSGAPALNDLTKSIPQRKIEPTAKEEAAVATPSQAPSRSIDAASTTETRFAAGLPPTVSVPDASSELTITLNAQSVEEYRELASALGALGQAPDAERAGELAEGFAVTNVQEFEFSVEPPDVSVVLAALADAGMDRDEAERRVLRAPAPATGGSGRIPAEEPRKQNSRAGRERGEGAAQKSAGANQPAVAADDKVAEKQAPKAEPAATLAPPPPSPTGGRSVGRGASALRPMLQRFIAALRSAGAPELKRSLPEIPIKLRIMVRAPDAPPLPASAPAAR